LVKYIWRIEKNKFIFAAQNKNIMQRNNLHIKSITGFSPLMDEAVFGADYSGA